MSNIITKAHPVPDMHSTGLRVVGAWLFAIVLILFSTVFVHVPYTREIQMVLAIPVLLFFGAPFYAGAWKGTRSGRNNIDRLVALTTSVAFLFSVFNTFFPDYWLGIAGTACLLWGCRRHHRLFPDRRVYGGTCPAKCVGGYLPVGRLAA